MRSALATVAIALVLLAGCGSSSGSDASGTTGGAYGGSATTTTAAGPGDDTAALAEKAGLTGKVNTDEDKPAVATATGGSIDMELDDFYLGPAFVDAPAGKTLHVEIENEGKATHTFTIDALKVDETVAPGKKAEVDVMVPATGALQVYCRFHKAGGMQGAILATG